MSECDQVHSKEQTKINNSLGFTVCQKTTRILKSRGDSTMLKLIFPHKTRGAT